MNFNSWNFTLGKFNIIIDRPILLLIVAVGLILGIIPFMRLKKGRRVISKHIIPFIIHILIITILATMVAGMRITETDKAPTDTNIIVVADMSDSNAPTKSRMEAYIKALYEQGADLEEEIVKIGVVAFGKNSVKTTEIGDTLDGCLDLEEGEIDGSATDINAAIEYAKSLFPDGRQNKRIVLLTDGRQTAGNAWSAAQSLLSEGIRLDGAYFNVADGDGVNEVQLITLKTLNPALRSGSDVEMEISFKSTVATSGTITVYDGENAVYTKKIVIKAGGNTVKFSYPPEGDGIHTVRTVLEADGDSIEANNTLYSWFEVKRAVTSILIVEGDNRQAKQLKRAIDDENYLIEVISDARFPDKMQDLLPYDEIILMNVNFSNMGSEAPELLKRYVGEVGRGLFVTCGSNTYDYASASLANSPIEEILPVSLRIDDRKQTVAAVMVVDLSSSMKDMMGSRRRYDVVKEGVKQCVDQLDDNAYIGIVVFDQSSKVAVPITPATQKEWIKQQIDEQFDKYYYGANINNPDRETHPVTFGTSYLAGFKEANNLIGSFKADLKQVVFMSDGAPSDKDSGYDGIVSRMANSGIVTCTVAIGDSKSEYTDELGRLATLGKGSFTVIKDDQASNLPDTLFKIASRVKGNYVNENRNIQPEWLNTSSSVSKDVDGLDMITGYYGTTIKDGATCVISVDDARPLYAEWKYGEGKTAVFMSNLGNEKWTGALFDDEDGKNGITLIKNMVKASLNATNASTGIKYDIERENGVTKITVDVPKNLRQGEAIVATVTLQDGTTSSYELSRIAGKRYRTTIETPDEQEIQYITVRVLENVISDNYMDTVDIVSVGYYDKEYDVFGSGGASLIEDITNVTGGKLMQDTSEFYDIKREEIVEYKHDILTPASILALVLFVLDIVFRNFKISFKKKEKEMTDEEQIASMRGR